MLDLLLFSSCIGVTKCISRQEATSKPRMPSSTSDGCIHKSPSSPRESYSKAPPATPLLYRASHIIFQMTLLLSLWLFCLSILEAAPASWLLVLHETSFFVQFYRINLWALCILLEVVIPSFLGVVVIFSGATADIDAPNSSPTPSSSKQKRSKNKLLLLIQVLWISVRFVFLASWYIIKKLLSMFLPSDWFYKDQGMVANSRELECINNNRLYRNCSPKLVLPVVFALSMSFWILGTLSNIVISDTSTQGYSNSDTNMIQHKHKISQYCLWIVGPHSPLKNMVKMACALGMIIASLLNGFGCASMPHANLIGMYLKPTSAAVLAKVEEDYFYAAQNLEEKKYMLSGMLRLTSSSSSLPADNMKIKQLKDEISFLENLVGDMSDDIDEMKHAQQLALKARTTLGRILWVLGIVFSIILVVRVVLAALSILRVSNKSISPRRDDPITMIVLWLTGHHIVSDEQYNIYLQGTSLILAGLLTISQVRNFFRVVGALGRKLSQMTGFTFDTKSDKMMGEVSLLMSSFVMGCYFLSCVVVIKITLPLEYRSSFSAAVGNLNDFGFNSTLLNMVFCMSTCSSAVVLGILFGVQRTNSERYSVESTLTSKGSFSEA